MKIINVIYNHNIFDEPYKQSEVKKTEKSIKERFGEDIEIYVTHTCCDAPNDFMPDSELIIAEHTFEMTADDKKALATILNKSVTKKRSAEQIDVVVTFRKIEESDLYYFEQGK